MNREAKLIKKVDFWISDKNYRVKKLKEAEEEIKKLENDLENEFNNKEVLENTIFFTAIDVKDAIKLLEEDVPKIAEVQEILEGVKKFLELYDYTDVYINKERSLLDKPVMGLDGRLSKKRLEANVSVIQSRVSGQYRSLETVKKEIASKYKDVELEEEIEAIRDQLTEVNVSLWKIINGRDELLGWERFGRYMGRKLRSKKEGE